jgi:hypothetical protein
MDALSLGIGIAVTKFAVKLWTGGADTIDLGGDLAGAFSSTVLDLGKRRSAGRQFDRLAEVIAERLEPILSREMDAQNAGELEAAVEGATRAFSTSLAGAKELIRYDLNSAQLSAYVKQSDAMARKKQALSDAGEAAYELIIDEGAAYAVAVASKLPDFENAFASELLLRGTQLLQKSEEILEQMPRSIVPTTWGLGSDFERFENRYRRSIFEYANKLQIFGVTPTAARSAYPLNIAYIPLQATKKPESKTTQTAPRPNDDEQADQPDTGSSSAEEALAGTDRALIAGDAGSGKTTLIQWITVSAAKSTFSGGLESWNGKVPFVIPLRRYVEDGFPPPEAFLTETVPSIAGAMPPGWVHSLLELGRAIVLVDGFDEVASERRRDVLDWLNDLTSAFPRAAYIVTSRHNAVESSWRGPKGFRQVRLLPMEMADIREFIQHWHLAALSSSSATADEIEIKEAQRTILLHVRDKPQLRNLCTSPLLCALICAMNIESGARLPDNRIELYDTALRMLVTHRDKARKLEDAAPVKLDFVQSNIILRDFAYWMHDNRVSDASKSNYESQVAMSLKRLHKVKKPAAVVSRHLLDRSGVIREPIEGRIDFIHRTFLEYLTAEAIAEQHSVAKLISLATDDHWREVIILSAGRFAPDESETMIRGLISRGKDEFSNRHLLYLLAVACMETAPELSEGLREELAECLQSVMPPSSMTTAAAIAAAGGLAVPLLENPPPHATDAAACVRALALIGGDAAFAMLKNYASDTRVTVSRQIVRAWSYFDVDAYASEILSKSPLERGAIVISDPESAMHIHRLPLLKRAYLMLQGRINDPALIPSSAATVRLEAYGARSVRDLKWLKGYKNLERLGLMNSSLVTLDGVEFAPLLQNIDIDGCTEVDQAHQLNSLEHLRRVDIARTSITSLPKFTSVLDSLRISDCYEIRDFGEPLNTRILEMTSHVEGTDFSGIEASTNLEQLVISHSRPDGVLPVKLPRQLKRLSLGGPNLQKPNFTGAEELETLSLGFLELEASWIDFILDRKGLVDVLIFGHQTDAFMEKLKHVEAHVGLRTVTFRGVDPRWLDAYQIEGFQRDPGAFGVVFSKGEIGVDPA